MALSRRKFLGTALTVSASGLIVDCAATRATAETRDLLVLDSEHVVVTLSRETGCVVKLGSKDQAWNLEGAGMRLHVPAPEHRFHYLTERHAGKPRIEADNKQAIITWMGFESPRMGKLRTIFAPESRVIFSCMVACCVRGP
jgi:hypothetical protein